MTDHAPADVRMECDLDRLMTLARLVTVRQAIEAGDDAIAAAGLNPWCMSEGLATGDERVHLWWADDLVTRLRALLSPPPEAQEVERLRAALAAGELSDGYHTHRELYEYRMLYNAHAANGWFRDGLTVVKSWRHSDGELCFGGGWFIVVAELPTGQVSNHYREEHWDLFSVLEVERPPEYDGHTPADAAERLRRALTQEDRNGE